MISREFESAISANNLLRARVMLKDSFVVDPTFRQLNEMLAYAKYRLPDIIVPFDGNLLEDDPSKWNPEVMNMELVQLVNNFSEERVDHLKQVVSKVMAQEKIKIHSQRTMQEAKQNATQYSAKQNLKREINNVVDTLKMKMNPKNRMVEQIMRQAGKLNKMLRQVKEQESYEVVDIDEVEQIARQILREIQEYKHSR